MKKKYILWVLIVWTTIVFVSYFLNYLEVETNNRKVILNKSKAFFELIEVTRFWNSEHGGVYVPIKGSTVPNQYLKDPLRDIERPDGVKLTKINPSYMTRQIAELIEGRYDIQFHITSLNPIRPANKPDEWEKKALMSFENGKNEVLDLIKNEERDQYRYMAPLYTETTCLKCHADQGYKYGDIRGGISVSFPSNIYAEVKSRQLLSLSFIHFSILLMGIIGLWGYYVTSRKYFNIINNQNNELIKANATKDKFLSIISHDLRAPFNGIIGLSELAFNNIRKKDYDKAEKYCYNMYKSSQEGYNLLNNLLQWSKIQSKRVNFNPQFIIFDDLVSDVIGLLNINIVDKKLTLNKNYEPGLVLMADEFMLESILSNLISNAIKYSKEKGTIAINAKMDASNLLVEVIDTGIGIEKEDIDKLFKLEIIYTTLGTHEEKGSGLGLLLCKEFVEKHSGTIWVESEKDKGTKFTFTIPQNKPVK